MKLLVRKFLAPMFQLLSVNKYIIPKFLTIGVTATAFIFGLSACEARNPFDIGWTQSPDTALLYSLARPELNLPSAFDFKGGRSYVVESAGATGSWDVVLDTQDNNLVFLLPGAIGIFSDARILELPGLQFADVLEAPKDTTSYTSDKPVILKLSSVYVVRTHSSPDAFGYSCSFFGKMQPLNIDVERGTLEFVHDTNTRCNDRDLTGDNPTNTFGSFDDYDPGFFSEATYGTDPKYHIPKE